MVKDDNDNDKDPLDENEDGCDHLGEDEDREPPHGGAKDGVDDGQGDHSTISAS